MRMTCKRKKGHTEEKYNENQIKMVDLPLQPMGLGENTACKPKMKVIPIFFIEDRWTQEFRDWMRATYSLICKFMGLWPT